MKLDETIVEDQEADDCLCDFTDICGGLGMLYCLGCGGDLCVCTCGGETECPGCEDCEDDDYDDDSADGPTPDEDR